jgi:GH15 family glucan-1,4-alpha-glucosidase
MPERAGDGYLPIEHYGAIGNLRTVALVGLDGSIDWCCLPELDRPSVFAAILDSQRGGRFRVAPAGRWRSEQRYLEGTNVLETLFQVEGGSLSVTDFMPLRGSILGAGHPLTAPEIHRLLSCEAGEVEVEVEWSPRFDYARTAPQILPAQGGYLAQSGAERLTLGGLPPSTTTIAEDMGGAVLRARFRLSAGERMALVTCYGAADAQGSSEECTAALARTVSAWREWAHHCERPEECAFGGPWHPQVIRSGLALKLLTHPDSGAIAAAATTSLPEDIGGVRNWDYRFTWIRDAAFTGQALFALGHRAEAIDFLNWAHRVSMSRGDRPFGLQIMYGLHGETELPESELEHLEGHRGSRPVRIGNGAAKQVQLDIYGELLGSAYELVRLGGRLDPPLMAFLSRVADRACDAWREPDYGIWEVRGGPRHFVYSKVMVWVALDRAVRMAERWGLPGRVGMWRRNRDAVRRAILSEGYDRRVGAFVQSFGSQALDASNLLIPIVGFLPFDDPRVQGTINRTLERLTENGLVYRYRADDGLPGREGAFALTTFWMVDALALSGRVEEAHGMFERVAAHANHVGLFSEEFDPRTGAFLGNFPQAFSHIGFINSALYLARAQGRQARAPAPVGSQAHGAETGHHTGAVA